MEFHHARRRRPAAKAKKSPAKPASAKKSPKKSQAVSGPYVILTNALQARAEEGDAQETRREVAQEARESPCPPSFVFAPSIVLCAQAAKKSPAKPAAKPAAKKCAGGVETAPSPRVDVSLAQVAREAGLESQVAGQEEEPRQETGLEGEESCEEEDGRQEVPGEAIHAQQEEVVVPVSPSLPLRRIP